MVANFTNSLGTRLTAEIAENVAAYLDKIEYRCLEDIDLLSRHLLNQFEASSHLSTAEFGAKIQTLKKLTDLSSAAQESAGEKLQSAHEMYEDAYLYVGVCDSEKEGGIREDPERTKCFQQLIIEKIKQTAKGLLMLDPKQKKSHIEALLKQNKKAQDELALFANRVSNIQSTRMCEASTLSDHQQFQLHHVKMEVDFHNLQNLQNPELDLHENTPLMGQLIDLDPTIYSKHHDLLKLNPALSDLAYKSFVEKATDDIELIEEASSLPNYRDIALAVVAANSNAIWLLTSQLQNDKQVVMAAITSDHRAFRLLYQKMRDDRDVILAVVSQRGFKWLTLPPIFQRDREVVLTALENQPELFAYLDSDLQLDREIALAAVKKRGINFKYLSQFLKNCKELVLIAVRSSLFAFLSSDRELQEDPEVLFEALMGAKELSNNNLTTYNFGPRTIIQSELDNSHKSDILSNKFYNDKDALIKALSDLGMTTMLDDKNLNDAAIKAPKGIQSSNLDMAFEDRRLRDNEEVVLAAVSKDGCKLQFASQHLQSNETIAMTAIENDPASLEFVSNDLKNDPAFAMRVLKKHKDTLRYFGSGFRNDRQLVMAAVKNCPHCFEFVSYALRGDREIALLALGSDKIPVGKNIEFMSKDLQNDREIVYEAIKNGGSLAFASEKIRNDLTFIQSL